MSKPRVEHTRLRERRALITTHEIGISNLKQQATEILDLLEKDPNATVVVTKHARPVFVILSPKAFTDYLYE